MHIDEKQFEDFVINSGIVSRGVIENAQNSKDAGTSVGDFLVSSGEITQDDLRRVYAHVLGIPYINLEKLNISRDALSHIPEPISRKHNIISYGSVGSAMEVAVLNIEDLSSIYFMVRKEGLSVLPRLTDTNSMKFALRQYQRALRLEFGDIISRETKTLSEPTMRESGGLSIRALKLHAREEAIVKVVDTLFQHALLQKATDIHIEPREAEVLVRYRINGALYDSVVLPHRAAAMMSARIKLLAGLVLSEVSAPQEGRFKVEIHSEELALRVSTIPTSYGERIVIRMLRESVAGFTLEGLGLHGEALEKLYDGFKERSGVVVTSGPIGAGKTTTLYTIIDLLNSPDVNIGTIENPIEYQMERINQVQVKPDFGITYASGVRALLRQDSDIIMIGEVNEADTALSAVNTALSGKRILSSTNSSSAALTISELLSFGVDGNSLASTLDVVVSQRLLPRLSNLREKKQLSREILNSFSGDVDENKIFKALKEEGVIKSDMTWSNVSFYTESSETNVTSGYVGIFEVLRVSPAIKELIRSGASAEEIEERARKEGMLTLLEDAIFKAAAGAVSIDDVFRYFGE
ncbi:MAG: Flp pilus assembly complex ATPase component TadA [Parcubacteria group bacterium]|nr:Flp pilus assembly complex ATPase component TadA [Parcubacteria group bacterium]